MVASPLASNHLFRSVSPPATKSPATPGVGRLPSRSFAVTPVHQRVAELCRESVRRGDFSAGERFPSERELAARFEISRATANKVLATLVGEGMLELQKGIGARVSGRRPLFASLAGMESFTAHARAQGREPSTEVRAFRRARAARLPAAVRGGLGCRADESVVALERLRLADGVPMILEFRWVREALAPGLCRDDVGGSFYQMLAEKFSLPMTGERHSISAVVLDATQSERFGVPEPTPALRVEGVGFVRDGEPLWYQRLFYRGDQYELKNETRGVNASGIALQLQPQS